MSAIIRAALIAVGMAAVFGAVTQVAAQTPLTMDRIRGMAAAGMAPFNADMEQLDERCPHLPFIVNMKPAVIGELSTTARAMGIEGGALWLRRNDAAIAACLGE